MFFLAKPEWKKACQSIKKEETHDFVQNNYTPRESILNIIDLNTGNIACGGFLISDLRGVTATYCYRNFQKIAFELKDFSGHFEYNGIYKCRYDLEIIILKVSSSKLKFYFLKLAKINFCVN